MLRTFPPPSTRASRWKRNTLATALALVLLVTLVPAAAAQREERPGRPVEKPDEPQFGREVDRGVPAEERDVHRLPALASDEAPDLEREMPAGDFTNPPLPPNAPQAQVEAERVRRAEQGAFDPETSVPIEAETTEQREVFENEDGSFTAELSTEPVRYRDEDGEWQDVDLGFEEAPDGRVTASRTPTPVELSADQPGGLTVETEAGPVSFSAPDVVAGQSAEPETDGRTAVSEARNGIETRIDVTRTGFEHAIVVPDASGPSSYALEVSLPPGLTVRQGETGVEFIGNDGAMLAWFGGGLAWDSAPLPDDATQGFEAGVTTTLEAFDTTSATIRVAVDEKWFTDTARVFPVTIDPW
ncbi:MAG: hypothetical protein AAGK32_17740, partial [Actinomycetota bacterium]